MKLIWVAREESRGIERNGATMKKAIEMKRMRERKV